MKLIAKIILALAIFFAGFYFGQQVLAPADGWINKQPKNQANQEIKVNLMLDFGNGEVQTFNSIALAENSSVFELLKKITAENKLEFSYKDYGGELGVLVESINKIANNNKTNRFWHYWVNNVYAEIGASNYQLKAGDIVEWKYVSNQFNLIKH
ncbi:MAG: DUF4430 domain-containing protein [Patescibacteria group bacterium]|jgi:hypothetical protein